MRAPPAPGEQPGRRFDGPYGKLAEPDRAVFAPYRGAMSDANRTLFLVCYDVCDAAV